jgi:hypothetical protein
VSVEDNKAPVRRFYEEVVNTGNVDSIDGLISPEYAEIHDSKRHAVGIEGAKARVLGVRQTYPDHRVSQGQAIGPSRAGLRTLASTRSPCGVVGRVTLTKLFQFLPGEKVE